MFFVFVFHIGRLSELGTTQLVEEMPPLADAADLPETGEAVVLIVVQMSGLSG